MRRSKKRRKERLFPKKNEKLPIRFSIEKKIHRGTTHATEEKKCYVFIEVVRRRSSLNESRGDRLAIKKTSSVGFVPRSENEKGGLDRKAALKICGGGGWKVQKLRVCHELDQREEDWAKCDDHSRKHRRHKSGPFQGFRRRWTSPAAGGEGGQRPDLVKRKQKTSDHLGGPDQRMGVGGTRIRGHKTREDRFRNRGGTRNDSKKRGLAFSREQWRH